ncbi:MAG: polysaccharide deacetylase family protein, partial [Atopostipes suicloacalis]|nr:polysaccharide deacetylase family protein [Atopostipes suicloacalis]
MTTAKKNRFNWLFSSLILFIFLLSPILSITAAPSQLVQKGNTTEKIVSLTFDDGSDGTNIQSILNILSKDDIKATFFLTGNGIKNHGSKIREIIKQGHDIGNHAYSHPYFTKI